MTQPLQGLSSDADCAHTGARRRFPSGLAIYLGLGAALGLGFSLGCNVFKADLYENRGGAGGAAGGAGGTGGASSEQWPVVADACPFPDGSLLSSDVRENTGIVKLNELANDIETCGKLTDFDGPDGVIGIELAAEQSVHVEVRLLPEANGDPAPVDLGIYMMNSCDPNACAKRVERCPAGVGEHFAWSTEVPGQYYFGFDSKAYDQTLYDPSVEISIAFPLCGDGKLDKGETCDDSNVVAGDGCDENCFAELAFSGVTPNEVEPNNYYKTGNVVLLGAGESGNIKGNIGGGCDLDFFQLDIPEGGFARVKMLAADGQDCPQGTPELVLEFDDPSGAADLGKAKIPAVEGTGSNYCPEWDETSFVDGSLPAGRYVVEMKPNNKGVGMDSFPYILQVEIVDGAGGAGGN